MKPFTVKRLVRERDGYRCVHCGMTVEQHKKLCGRTLDVHRLIPGSVYTVEGCVTVCRGCHYKEPKSPPGTYANGTGTLRLNPEWLKLGRKVAKLRRQPFQWFVLSCIADAAQAAGLEVPRGPWHRIKT
jgi:hypothetical protein